MKIRNIFFVLTALTMVACGSNDTKKEESAEDNKGGEETNHTPNTNTTIEGARVAWVNVDSVSLKYKRIMDANAEAEEKMEKMSQQLKALEHQFQNEYTRIQKEFPTMLKTQQEAAQQKLQKMEINLQQTQAEYQQEMAAFESNVLRGNFESLYDFINKYASENGYDYVLSMKFGGEMLYGNPAYDITNDVIEGLNEAYEKSLDPNYVSEE